MTNNKKWQAAIAIIVALAIIVIDQIIKIEVKTSMTLHESIRITDWFYILYIENNGMAWGMSIMPKIMLSLFRFVAIFVIGWYIARQILRGARMIYIVLLSMLLERRETSLTVCSMGLFSPMLHRNGCLISFLSARVMLRSSKVEWWICSISRSS